MKVDILYGVPFADLANNAIIYQTMSDLLNYALFKLTP